MAKAKKKNRVIILVMRSLGLVFLGVGAFLSYQTYDFMDNALPATGTVVSVEKSYSDDGGVTYKPTIRYIDWNQNKQRGETFLSSSGYNFPLGSKQNIYYDLRDPASIRLDSWFEIWGFGVIMMAASIIPLFISFIISWASRDKSPTTAVEEMRERPERFRRPERAPSREPDDGYINMESNETPEEHEREQNYRPTVRRGRDVPTIRR